MCLFLKHFYNNWKMFVILLFCSFTGSLRTITNYQSANWPSFTARDTLIPCWSNPCGRRSWTKVSVTSMQTFSMCPSYGIACFKCLNVNYKCLKCVFQSWETPWPWFQQTGWGLLVWNWFHWERFMLERQDIFLWVSQSYHPAIMFSFPLVRIFQLANCYFANCNWIRLPIPASCMSVGLCGPSL